MAEAQAKAVVFDDIREDTFSRFCQFAYSGDYDTPAAQIVPEKDPEGEAGMVGKADTGDEPAPIAANPPAEGSLEDPVLPAPPPPPPAAIDDWGVWSTTKSKKKAKRVDLRRAFDLKTYEPTSPSHLATCKPKENSSPNEDYTQVFLAHARLYVFAEKYGVENLKSLTLHYLHKTLLTFKLYESRIADILELIWFACSDENTPSKDDELRSLVIHYVACEDANMTKSEDFLTLLEDGGPFVRELWLKIRSDL
ncbi:hypothetical protein MMC19_006432 [Ptychographa xylographoides]|nr:hypothetical protein [Ptychographa xylographoides]